MASEESQKYYLGKAIEGLERADMYLKRSNGADQLCTGLVCDCWTYEEMIEHLIVGIKEIFEGEIKGGCDHYWVWFVRSQGYKCVRCGIPQNVDASTMHINNRNVERCE